MSLALETRAPRLLIDERAARRTAEALGLSVVGTLGVLLAAKRRREIEAVRPLVEALRQQGFWIAPSLVKSVIAAAGEM